jgi:HEAT repeat protein
VRPYLEELVERLADRAPLVGSSEDSVSWRAHREAESLSDPTMVDELVQGAVGQRSKHIRAACYFAIGMIGRNLGQARVALVLLQLLEGETDKYNLASLLQRIGGIPKLADCDLSKVYEFLEDKRWLVRHAAIDALDNSANPEVEERLLRHLAEASDHHDKIHCHSVLNRIGTPRSLGPIEANLESRKRDVKLSAQAALAAIRQRNG